MQHKRIGLIDNLGDVISFTQKKLLNATASEVMEVTGGNTGNIAFVEGIKKLLNFNVVRISWSTSPEWISKNIDLIVIACANQLGAHVDLKPWAERIALFNKPTALIGLGAQSESREIQPDIPQGTLDFLNIIKELKPNGVTNITSRGEFSTSVLTKHGISSIPAGCPSLHLVDKHDLGSEIFAFQNKTSVKKISIAAGNPWHQKSANLEKRLTDIVDHYNGAYVLQHPTSMLSLALGEEVSLNNAQMEGYLKAYEGKYSREQLIEWYRRNAVFFIDIGNWMQFYKRFDFVLGPRYHGVALAIQAARPATVISIDSRTEELCEFTGVKQLNLETAKDLTINDLISYSRWTKEDAERLTILKTKQRIAYSNFLESIGAT